MACGAESQVLGPESQVGFPQSSPPWEAAGDQTVGLGTADSAARKNGHKLVCEGLKITLEKTALAAIFRHRVFPGL